MAKRKNESSSQEQKNKKKSFSPSKPSASTAEFNMDTSEDRFFHDSEPTESFKSQTISDSNIDIITPGRKRSFKRISVANESPQLPMNDDGTELIEAENLEDNGGKSDKDALSQDVEDKGMSIVHSMTVDQMKEHVHRCLELNTENKINAKNVFALRLIDCMTILSRSEDENNFAAMACQLDAGAKIYSLRVDAVHTQVMKLVESCIFAEKKAKAQNADGEVDSDDDGEPGPSDGKLKDKKKKRKKVLAPRDQITRKLQENDPKEKYFNCEALPGGIFDQLRFDPEDLTLSLAKDTPFWMNWTDYKPIKAEEKFCEIDKIEIGVKSIGPNLEGTLESSMVSVSEPSYIENALDEPTGLVDLDEPIRDSDDDDDKIQNEPNVDIKEEDQSKQSLPESELVSRAMTRMKKAGNKEVSRLDVLKALFHKAGENDYHYLKKSNSKYWAGPKRGIIKVANKKKPAGRKKKEPIEIQYTEEAKKKSFNPKCKSTGLSSKRRTTLSDKMCSKWKMAAVTYKRDIHFDQPVLFMLFHVELENVSMFHQNQNDDPPEGSEEIQPAILGDFDTLDDPEDYEDPELPEIPSPVNWELSSDSEGDFPGFPEAAVEESSNGVQHNQDSNDEFLGFSMEGGIDNATNDGENGANDADDIACEGMDTASQGEGVDTASQGDGVDTKAQGEDMDLEGAVGPDPKIKQETCDVYEGENLVPMVKIVNVEPIKYTVKPQRIDMGHLKQVMFSIIVRMLEDRENEMRAGGQSQEEPYVQFRDVLTELANSDELHHRTREDLTAAMAFLTLLFLANEHNLCLEPPDGGSDTDPRISFSPGERPALGDIFLPEGDETDSD